MTSISAFVHANDRCIRVGDYVATSWELQEASPSSCNASQMLRLTAAGEAPRAAGTNDDPANAASGASDPTARRFGADTRSLDAWWRSMTSGTWLSHTARRDIAGVVLAVDVTRATAEVTVWKHGDEVTASAKFKPVERVALSDLRKLTLTEFNQLCRREFMRTANYHLRLRGEGFDEAAPFALIAHNNRIVSTLIDRIDTTPHISAADLKRRRPRGPAALKQAPIPTLIPVEDPLAEVRGELRALAAGGVTSKRARGGGGGPSGAAAAAKKKEPMGHAVDSDCAGPTNMTPGFSILESSAASYAEDAVMEEGRATRLGLVGRLTDAMSALAAGSRGRYLPSVWYERHHSESHTALQCRLSAVSDSGTISLFPIASEAPPFVARLADVALLPGRAACEQGSDDALNRSGASPDAGASSSGHSLSVSQGVSRLCTMIGDVLDVWLIAPNAQGIALVRALHDGEQLSELLVREGLAVVDADLFEHAPTLLGIDVATRMGCPREQHSQLQRLWVTQRRAQATKVGLWGQPQAAASFLPVAEEEIVRPVTGSASAMSLALDEGCEEGEPLPSLFGAYETSLLFQSRLLTAVSQSADA